MDAFMAEVAERADSFRNNALPIVAHYKEFWDYARELTKRIRWVNQYFNPKSHRKLTNKLLAKRVERIVAFVINYSPNEDLLERLADYLNPTREVIVYATINILKHHKNDSLNRLFEDYKTNVVDAIIQRWNDYLWKIANSDEITNTLSPDIKYTYAVMGMLKAIHKFDFHSGKAIPTFAYNWIKDQVKMGGIAENSVIHISAAERTKAITYMKKRGFKDDPTDETMQRYKDLIVNSNRAYVTSLDAKVKDNDDITYGDILSASEHSQDLLKIELQMTLERTLDKDELRVLRAMFFSGNEKVGVNDVAEELSMSPKLVTKLFKKAKDKLSTMPELKELLKEIVNGGDAYEAVRMV